MLNHAADVVAYLTLALLALLFVGNVVITVARLSNHRAFASQVSTRLKPFASVFRIGELNGSSHQHHT